MTDPAQREPRSWTLHVCRDCREPAHGPGSRCSKDKRRTWTLMDAVTVVSLADVVALLEAAYDPQNPLTMHPGDFIRKRYEMNGHEGLEYA